MPRKYGLVRAIAFILKLLGWVILIACIVAGIFGGVTLFSAPSLGLPAWLGTGTIMVAVLTGLFWFVPFYGFGSILSLLLDIEENTRALSEYSSPEVANRTGA
jgi:hypothetical protein